MKKTFLLVALLVATALPAAAQTAEFGILFGGSSRIGGDDDVVVGGGLDDGFSFSNSAIELYYAVPLDPGTKFKIKAGRLENAVGFATDGHNPSRRDFEGELQHLSGVVEYRFSEAFGSTGLFIGAGLYRQEGGGLSETDYGFNGGLNADFPMSRRYGVVTEATFHWTNFELNPKYLTFSAGLRISF